MGSLVKTFSTLCVVSLVSGAALALAIERYGSAVTGMVAAHEARLDSILLADEIRQGSDDLTRLGRTYVVTGDPSWKRQYQDVLDIRGGHKPRPTDYQRIYWDFVGAGQAKPRPDGETASIAALMDRLGFAQAEKDKLAESVRNSDGLVKLEVEAMNLVEGKDAGGRPLAEPNPDRDRLRAVALLHSPAYHGFKAQIMRPLDDFYGMLKSRTDEAVRAQGVTARFWFGVVLAALLATIASGLGLGWFAYRALVRGYAAIGAAMGGIAAGDYATAVPGQARADEVGDMARRLEAFRQDLARARDDQTTEAERTRLQARRAEMDAVAASFEAAVGGILRTVTASAGQVRETAGAMTGTASETASRSSAVAEAAQAASAHVGSVAVAAEELSASVQEIARQVGGSATLAKSVAAESSRIAGLVEDLSTAATRVGDVVAMISAIASQTNLLALNATIEAARAGESGRGFAVVASEVKALAGQTARATDQIREQIGAIQGATRQAVAAIAGITTRIEEISAVSAAIAAGVEEQGAATSEIVRSVGEAADGTGAVTANITGVADIADESGKEATRLLDHATAMSRQSDALDAEIARFLATIRAA
ncbi:methyl-accepting chemotaxis protein [Methylobacterium planeticum]|uniref:HAMP domain-containing protein n=1 Tax=Methylobacterium planeticum TaxID=2615211 RepID=A0A6N6MRW7_9HYPH|nr:methyl-accepting chemotaxis protein [Methylobacterium planeticum]KAB1073060.1 HAMP domain-containing protein [Methylobacterium planeticum]